MKYECEECGSIFLSEEDLKNAKCKRITLRYNYKHLLFFEIFLLIMMVLSYYIGVYYGPG